MCFAKLLTAGTVPLAATVTTEEVFGHFSGDSKAQALLHGHSYSGHPIGCHIAIGSLATLAERNPNLVAGERGACARMSDGSHPSVRGGGGCVAGRDVCSCVASGHMQDIWDDKMAVEMSR